jgi:rhodanese-related sulfurtransferase
MKNLDSKTWEQEMMADDNAVILDVRTPEENEEKRIPNSLLINIQDAQNFMDEIEKLDKSKSYYVYCKSGGRSMMACQVMSQAGYKHLTNLDGGITAWHGEVESGS